MKLRVGSLLFVVLLAAPCLLQGAAGDLIGNVNLPVTGFGVSIAVDCLGNVYYTLDSDNSLYRMDKAGTLLGTTPIVTAAGGPILIDEFAWDEGRQVLWGQQHATNPINIYTINPISGLATFKFAAGSSIGTFRDGLAYDGSDDTLWISGDVSTVIDHVKATDGTPATPAQITPLNGIGGALGLISGVIAGTGDVLFLGQNGRQQIVTVKKTDGSFLGVFASPGGARDEGLECDAVNFPGKLALWSREFNSPGFASVIELVPGTCSCSGGGVTTPTPSVIVPTLNTQGSALFIVLLAGAGLLLLALRLK